MFPVSRNIRGLHKTQNPKLTRDGDGRNDFDERRRETFVEPAPAFALEALVRGIFDSGISLRVSWSALRL